MSKPLLKNLKLNKLCFRSLFDLPGVGDFLNENISAHEVLRRVSKNNAFTLDATKKDDAKECLPFEVGVCDNISRFESWTILAEQS